MKKTLAALALAVALALPASRALAAEGQAPSEIRPALTGVAEGQAPSEVRPALTGVAEGQAPSGGRPALTGVGAAPDEVGTRVMLGADLTLPELLRAGGGFSYVMIVLSMAVAAAGVYCAIECRGGRVAPADERARVAELLAEGDRAGAVSALDGAPSLYARGVRRALSCGDASPDEMRALLRASGEHDAAVLRGRLAMLPRIAAIGALVGVLGTLVGMHQAFGVAAMEVYRPLYAYAAVFKGLVLSVFGVGLAAVALAVYYVLAGRLERALAEAAYAFEEVALSLRRAPSAASGAGVEADARPGTRTPPIGSPEVS